MCSSKKIASGTVTKRVDCEGCGRSYVYDLSRTVTGTSSKRAANQTEADAQAFEDAKAKLQTALANGCDPVGCPCCGTFTKEMKIYRWKRFGAAFACLSVGAATLLVVYLLILSMHKILIVATLLGAVCFFLGLAILGVGTLDLLVPKKGRL